MSELLKLKTALDSLPIEKEMQEIKDSIYKAIDEIDSDMDDNGYVPGSEAQKAIDEMIELVENFGADDEDDDDSVTDEDDGDDSSP